MKIVVWVINKIKREASTLRQYQKAMTRCLILEEKMKHTY